MAQELEQNQYMKLIVRIPDELHKKLKVKAAQNGTTMTDLVVECLEKIVKWLIWLHTKVEVLS